MKYLFILLSFFFIPQIDNSEKLVGKWELVKINFSGSHAKEFSTLWNPKKDYYGIEIFDNHSFKSYQYKVFENAKWEAYDEGRLQIVKNTFFFKEFTKYEHIRNGQKQSLNSHCGSGEFYCHPAFMEPWEHKSYTYKLKNISTLIITFNDAERRATWHFKKVDKLIFD